VPEVVLDEPVVTVVTLGTRRPNARLRARASMMTHDEVEWKVVQGLVGLMGWLEYDTSKGPRQDSGVGVLTLTMTLYKLPSRGRVEVMQALVVLVMDWLGV